MNSAQQSILSIRNLYKSYGNIDVLRGIDLDIAPGEMVGIVGKSGAGKSTLLHIAGTLDTPDRGNLQIDGMELSGKSSRQLADFRNAHIGFIFQSHHLLPEFTALENVTMPALLGSSGLVDHHKVEAKALRLLDEVGVGHRKTHQPGALSGGEQQRVAIARALMNDPKIVFADEPTGNLDSETSEQVHELFIRLNALTNQTFIIVTHNDALAQICHRRIVMADGKIMSR